MPHTCHIHSDIMCLFPYWSLRWKTASAPVPGSPKAAANLSWPLYTSRIHNSASTDPESGCFKSGCKLVTSALMAMLACTTLFSGGIGVQLLLSQALTTMLAKQAIKANNVTLEVMSKLARTFKPSSPSSSQTTTAGCSRRARFCIFVRRLLSLFTSTVDWTAERISPSLETHRPLLLLPPAK
jgi:hypothetical protein